MPALGLDWDSRFTVTDQVTGQTFEWGAHDYVRLDPFSEPAHVLTVRTGQA
jgi:starch synthase (maltosyl-transferring)